MTSDLSKVCTKMIESDGVQRVERLEAGVSAWDGEAKVDTKHANLEQVGCSLLIFTLYLPEMKK